MPEPLQQAGLALAYYLGLIAIMRVAGKRLAGQTTTFDLLVLIALGVVLQTTVLMEGRVNAVVFIGTVLLAHVGLARACAHSRRRRKQATSAPSRTTSPSTARTSRCGPSGGCGIVGTRRAAPPPAFERRRPPVPVLGSSACTPMRVPQQDRKRSRMIPP
jgi:hypothetical protein